MTGKLRMGLLACAGIAALAVSGPALAAFMPQLAVSATANGSTLIHYSQPSGDDALLKTTIYSDAKLTANLTAAAGTTIGTVAAKTAAGALGGATLPLGGPNGQYTWRATATPWTPGTATPNPAGTVEVQSKELKPIPSGILAASAKRKGTTASVSGSVEEAGSGVAGAHVLIRGGTKAVTV